MDRNRKTMIFGLGLIVFIGVLYFIFLSAPQGPNPQPFVSNITVVNSNGSNINGVYVINGVVENKNPFSVTVVNLNATGFNTNSSSVTTGSGFTTQSPIPAGGTSNFSISLYDPNRVVTTYNVRVVDASK